MLVQSGFEQGCETSASAQAVESILRWREVAVVGANEAAVLHIHVRTLEALHMVRVHA